MRAILGRKRKKLYCVFLTVIILLTVFIVIAQTGDTTGVLPARPVDGSEMEVIFPATVLTMVIYIMREDEGAKQ